MRRRYILHQNAPLNIKADLNLETHTIFNQFCISRHSRLIDISPTAVILEAPFTNILEAAASYPLTIVSIQDILELIEDLLLSDLGNR